MADKFDAERKSTPNLFGGNITEHSVGATDLPPETRAVCFNADGTADVTNQDGTTCAGVPVFAMQPMMIVPKRVTAMATATKCYLIR